MKKNILKTAAVCTAALMMSSCVREPIVPYDYETGSISITLADIVSVNTVDTALRYHDNCYVTCNLKGEDYWGFGTYQDDEMFFREYFGAPEDSWQSTVYFNGGQWFMRYDGEGRPVLAYNWLAMSGEEKYEKHFRAGRTELFYNRDRWKEQTVTDIQRGADGRNTVTMYTRSPDTEVQAMTDRYDLHNTKYWFATLEHEYTYNPSTLEIEYDYNYLRLHNGKKYIYYTTLVQYDVLPPDYMKMMTATIEMTAADDSQPLKTVTIVYDDGQSYTLSYNGLYTVTPIVSEGYGLYMDKEGATPFEGELPYEELTLYAVRK